MDQLFISQHRSLTHRALSFSGASTAITGAAASTVLAWIGHVSTHRCLSIRIDYCLASRLSSIGPRGSPPVMSKAPRMHARYTDGAMLLDLVASYMASSSGGHPRHGRHPVSHTCRRTRVGFSSRLSRENTIMTGYTTYHTRIERVLPISLHLAKASHRPGFDCHRHVGSRNSTFCLGTF